MRRLFASTCLTPIAFGLLSSPAFAATATISSAQTTPVKTSSADSGAAADVSITSAGSITPTAGTAVTIDSNNSVTNAGTITITGVNDTSGILANAGTAGTITNSGTITDSETYTRTDTNGDGVLDGAWAQGSDRYGIRTAGAFTGNVLNSGSITVEGNNSAGISLDGPLTGSLNLSAGTITVTGDDSVGVRAGAISGDASIAGSIAATGGNATGVQLNGDIGGALVVQSTITTTGYSSTTLPTDTTKLTGQNLLQGGPAMQISGSVAGGALFTTATSTTNSDGSTTTTTAAALTSYGSAPALLVGAADHAITLGSVTSDANKNGLVISGTIAGAGIYDGKTASGLVIGGQGGAVTVTNGMTLAGSVTATSNDATATGIRVGSGASVPAITSSGTITANGASKAGDSSIGLQIDAGGTVSTITNSGTITASAAGTAASTYAILDQSGTVTAVTNTGTITTGGSTAINVAIDLSASTANTTVTQSAPSSGTPSITGDIRFGSGSDTLNVSAGSVTGNVSFGGGTNTMALSGSATYSGTADFGGGAGSLTIGGTSNFSGTLAYAGGVALGVSGGTLNLSGTGATAIGSLQVTGGGTLGVTIDGTTGAATLYQVAGNASFDADSKLALHFSDLTHTVGTYEVITAGSLTGADHLSTSGATLPWLFKSTIATNAAGNTVDVTVARKTAADLGLNRSESAAYDAIYTAISGDKPIGDSFLAITDSSSFSRALRSMLPDHAGGSFDAVSSGSRATARFLADPDAPLVDEGSWGFWLQQVGWGRTKAIDDTAGYKITGWGASGGAEIKAGGFGRFGLGIAYLSGTNDDTGTENDVTSNQYELSAYWRGDWGGLHAWARASGATIDFKSHRRFDGNDDGTQVIRTADGKWNGKLYSGSGGLSYIIKLGGFSLRPQASIDYYRLHEAGYSEAGGGTGLDLVVDGRTNDEFAANGAIALGYRFFDATQDEGGFLRAEIEGGRRQLISSKLGDTVAHFAGGEDFTLTADDRTSGWTGAFRLKGGTSGYTISGEFDAEQQQDHVSVALRAGLQVGF